MGKSATPKSSPKRRVAGKRTVVKQETAAATHKRNLSNMLTCLARDVSLGVPGSQEAKEQYSGLKNTSDRKAFVEKYLRTSAQGGAKKWTFALTASQSSEKSVVRNGGKCDHPKKTPRPLCTIAHLPLLKGHRTTRPNISSQERDSQNNKRNQLSSPGENNNTKQRFSPQVIKKNTSSQVRDSTARQRPKKSSQVRDSTSALGRYMNIKQLLDQKHHHFDDFDTFEEACEWARAKFHSNAVTHNTLLSRPPRGVEPTGHWRDEECPGFPSCTTAKTQ